MKYNLPLGLFPQSLFRVPDAASLNEIQSEFYRINILQAPSIYFIVKSRTQLYGIYKIWRLFWNIIYIFNYAATMRLHFSIWRAIQRSMKWLFRKILARIQIFLERKKDILYISRCFKIFICTKLYCTLYFNSREETFLTAETVQFKMRIANATPVRVFTSRCNLYHWIFSVLERAILWTLSRSLFLLKHFFFLCVRVSKYEIQWFRSIFT